MDHRTTLNLGITQLRDYAEALTAWYGYMPMALPERYRRQGKVKLAALHVETDLVPAGATARRTRHHLGAAIGKSRQIQINAPGGMGKSMLLHRAALETAGRLSADPSRSGLLPVMICPSDLDLPAEPGLDDLLNAWRRHDHAVMLRATNEWLRNRMEAGSVLMLVDDADRSGLATVVREGIARYPATRWIIASRSTLSSIPAWAMAPLSADQSTRIVQRMKARFPASRRADRIRDTLVEARTDLEAHPMYLCMSVITIAHTHRRARDDIELHEDLMSMIEHDLKDQPGQQVVRWIEHAALAKELERDHDLSSMTGLEAAMDRCDGDKAAGGRAPPSMDGQDAVLIPRGSAHGEGQRFGFIHRSICEHLAARFLARMIVTPDWARTRSIAGIRTGLVREWMAERRAVPLVTRTRRLLVHRGHGAWAEELDQEVRKARSLDPKEGQGIFGSTQGSSPGTTGHRAQREKSLGR